MTANWAKMRVVEVRQPRNFHYEGLTIAELAEATGKHPMDAMLDLALDSKDNSRSMHWRVRKWAI